MDIQSAKYYAVDGENVVLDTMLMAKYQPPRPDTTEAIQDWAETQYRRRLMAGFIERANCDTVRNASRPT